MGLSEDNQKKIENAYTKPYGMILSTGPTGSGKTSSIYAMIKALNRREVNITTIEDPVEYEMENVTQIQVNNKTDLTFANGLRSILRQDPDIVFVGEIRDTETASIAIKAAMTGHLVLSTIHTNDAASTIPRLMDMEAEPFLVASGLNLVIAQRLVRKICEHCRTSYEVSLNELSVDTSVGALIADKNINSVLSKYFDLKKKTTLYKGQGCSICRNTGYLGRVGVFEVLDVTPEIRNLIISRSSAEAIKQEAVRLGMKTMLEDGLSKVINGITTLEEVLRATKE